MASTSNIADIIFKKQLKGSLSNKYSLNAALRTPFEPDRYNLANALKAASKNKDTFRLQKRSEEAVTRVQAANSKEANKHASQVQHDTWVAETPDQNHRDENWVNNFAAWIEQNRKKHTNLADAWDKGAPTKPELTRPKNVQARRHKGEISEGPTFDDIFRKEQVLKELKEETEVKW
jgi:hypothetical protein